MHQRLAPYGVWVKLKEREMAKPANKSRLSRDRKSHFFEGALRGLPKSGVVSSVAMVVAVYNLGISR